MSMKSPLYLTILLLLTAAPLAYAQASGDALSQKELQAAKELVETERNMQLIINLEFTEEENEAFWPLYDEYRAKLRSIRERKLSLIQDYADRYWAGTVDNEFADSAIKEALKIQADTVKLRQKYWKKFRRIVPATKAARFYQLENKMDAEVDYVLAGGVPLVEQ